MAEATQDRSDSERSRLERAAAAGSEERVVSSFHFDRWFRFDRWIKQYLPKTLFGRALLIIVTPLVLMQAFSAYVFYDRHWDIMTRRLVHSLAGDIAFLIQELEQPITSDQVQALSIRARNHFDLQLFWQPDAILPNQPPPGWLDATADAMEEAMSGKVRRPYVMNTESIYRRIEILIQLPNGVLQVVANKKRLFSSTTYIFLLWMVGSSLVLFAIAIIFMRNQIRPIRRLSIAARAYGLGRDMSDFKPEGATEVRQAASAFLQMKDRISRQLTQRTEMLAGVSHDLRTPLTRMKLQFAMLPKGPELEDLSHDVDEMQRMVEGYLAFARGEGTETPIEVDVATLIADVVNTERRDGSNIILEMPDPGAAVMPVRPDALKRAVANLIQNAKRYAKRIRVAVVRTGEFVDITVDDDGPGIPPEKRADAFRPFVRLEPSRNPAFGGTGLGLTIARDIARGHGGELTLQTAGIGGLRAVVRLPV